jgi:cytoskeletal protein CcmA (bactofilin family)
MGLWSEKSTTPISREATVPLREPVPLEPLVREPVVAERPNGQAAIPLPVGSAVKPEPRESVIAAGISIEGKVQGVGHLRISGVFKGDVAVDGNLVIEVGAKLTGQVRATTITVAGELEGNIDGAKRVELLETGVIAGDVKAGSVTIAAGSRMRGQVEFGWDERLGAAATGRG